MVKRRKRNSVIIIGGFIMIEILLSHCACNNLKTSPNKWYEETKAEILKQSEYKPDSTTFTFNHDSSYRRAHFFFHGQEFLMKGYNKGHLRLEIHYSKDRNFELRREWHDNGIWGFEGIVYKKDFYGLSTWRHSNGQIEEQGIRCRNEKIGIWKTWSKEGKIIEQTDYKNIGKVDSMPKIINYK
jgi:antitoxin component YwqK of YwqJK toxin-antitoxin module